MLSRLLYTGTFALVTASLSTGKKGEPPQIPVTTFKAIGTPERGFALMTKERFHTTADLPSGLPAQDFETNESQVTELSTKPLDPALFDVPKNFRKVAQIRRAMMQALGWLDYCWARLKRAM